MISLFKKIEGFFSHLPTKDSFFALGLMRMLVASALFGLYIWRQFEIGFFFTDKESIILRNESLQLISDFYRTPFSFFIWPEAWIPFVHLMLIILLLLLALGVSNRPLTFLTWFISLSFFQRNLYVAYGADLVGCLWLFYLSWTQHNVRFSILNYFKPDRPLQIKPDFMTTCGYRMIQLQICVIYGFTGLQKLKGMSWWDGTSLWTVLGSSQMAVFDFQWASHFPLMIAILVFSTLFFEIYFPMLVWNSKTRTPVLIFGLLFHGGIAISMGIWSFSIIMLSSYFLFIENLESNFKNITAQFEFVKITAILKQNKFLKQKT